MTALAPTLQSFFTDYLISQRGCSGHIITTYRDSLRLLLGYVYERTGIRPSDLDFTVLDAELIADFLTMLEAQRGNSTRTRNARLAAIHCLFKHAALRHPEHADLIARVLAIPTKKTRQAVVSYLNGTEIEALLASPDRSNWTGRRDHTLLLLTITTGVRVSERTCLTRADTCTDAHGAHIAVHGKGRKDRLIPLDTNTAAALRIWLTENHGPATASVFTAPGTVRKMTTDAVAQRIRAHATTAAEHCPTMACKNATPHAMRHSCAMQMRASGIDVTTIALWLGHESPDSSRPYLHADLALKQRALDRTAPPHTRRGRYVPPDKLLAYLESL